MQMLLGAMEQQEVTVAKAGMCATLPARTTIIAAANPAGGTWQAGKTMLENLKITPGLLSRFDLAFVMLDTPDRQHDTHVSEQVLAKHAGRSSNCHAQQVPAQHFHSATSHHDSGLPADNVASGSRSCASGQSWACIYNVAFADTLQFWRTPVTICTLTLTLRMLLRLSCRLQSTSCQPQSAWQFYEGCLYSHISSLTVQCGGDACLDCAGRGGRAAGAGRPALSQQAGGLHSASQQGSPPQRLPLAERLRRYSEEDAESPPQQLLKKYIAYAKAHVHPELSPEAKQVRHGTACVPVLHLLPAVFAKLDALGH